MNKKKKFIICIIRCCDCMFYMSIIYHNYSLSVDKNRKSTGAM